MAWIKVHAGTQRKKYWFNSDTLIHITEYELKPPSPTTYGHQSTLSSSNTLTCKHAPLEIMALINKERELIRAMEKAAG